MKNKNKLQTFFKNPFLIFPLQQGREQFGGLLLLAFFTFLFTSTYSQGIMLGGKNYSVDTLLYQMQIGPGVYHSSYRLPNYSLNFQVLEVDLTNPYNQIETVKAGDKGVAQEQPTRMAKRKDAPGHRIVGGTNGDFYFYQDVIENGIPRSGQFLNGEMIANPTGRASFILSKEKKPYVDRVSFRADLISGENKTRIHTVNMLRLEWEPNAPDFLTLYTDKFGTETRYIPGGTKVIVRPKSGENLSVGANDTIVCVVESIQPNTETGVSPIPAGKGVLHGREGASDFLQGLTVGSEVTMAFRTRLRDFPNKLITFKELVGGSNCIVLKHGKPQDEAATAASGQHPRTGMGFSQDSTRVYMVVADGRSGVSVGLDLYPFGELFKAIGAWNAVNLDGGGSSVMFVNDQKIVNVPSGGTEREVGNGVLVVSTAPDDDEIGIIKPYKISCALPYLGEYIPKFYGYNQYGGLLDTDLQGVELSCPPSLGTISGNKFIATGDTPGKITATYNGNIVTTIDVYFLPVSGIKIRLDTVLIDNREAYPIEVVATTSAGESLISSEAFTWEVENPKICIVEKGAIKGLRNGYTKLIGSLDDISGELGVKVEIPSAPCITGDSILLDNWTMAASSFLKAKFDGENLPENWTIGSAVNFVYKAGRAPYIRLTNDKKLYGLPDTVKLVMNIGDMTISKAIVTLYNNFGVQVSTQLTNFEQNGDFSLDIPLDNIFKTSDKGIYPIKFDNVNFYIDASNMTEGKSYTLAFKEIRLCYKDYVSTYVSTQQLDKFQVFPNPLDEGNRLNIKLSDALKNKNLQVQAYSLSGSLIYSQRFEKSNTGLLQLDFKPQSGTYILEIRYDNQSEAIKLIVK